MNKTWYISDNQWATHVVYIDDPKQLVIEELEDRHDGGGFRNEYSFADVLSGAVVFSSLNAEQHKELLTSVTYYITPR